MCGCGEITIFTFHIGVVTPTIERTTPLQIMLSRFQVYTSGWCVATVTAVGTVLDLQAILLCQIEGTTKEMLESSEHRSRNESRLFGLVVNNAKTIQKRRSTSHSKKRAYLAYNALNVSTLSRLISACTHIHPSTRKAPLKLNC